MDNSLHLKKESLTQMKFNFTS